MQQAAFWDDDRTIEEAFRDFHARNPGVLRELVAMTRRAKERGRTKIGMGMLFEVLRWNRIVEGLPDETEDFKLNNNYRSRYARMVMHRYPDLDGMFDLRRIRTP